MNPNVSLPLLFLVLYNSDSLFQLSRRHSSKIYFLEASIDFFINNRSLDGPPTGKSSDLTPPVNHLFGPFNSAAKRT